jgi:predicted amidohydrolase YtcJ
MGHIGLGLLPAFTALSGGSMVLAATLPVEGQADMILVNGQVKTSTGWAEAMAVRDGIVTAVGKTSEIRPLGGPKTTIIDVAGETVLPGLHDIHVHPIYGGINEMACKIAQGSSMAATLKEAKACADAAAPGEWVTGGQWDASALGTAPHKRLLDKVTAGHPIYLEDTSAHSAWVNSKALELAGITAKTPDPKGGIIERDASGAPTGVLRESATQLVYTHIPKASEEKVRAALTWSARKMLSYGITSFTEAAVGFTAGEQRELEAYDALADKGILKQRITICMVWVPGNENSDQIIAARNYYIRPRISPDCIKMFLDGVPTDSHTAAMLEPYADTIKGRTDDAARYGMLLINQDVLDKAVTRFDRMGLTVKFHAAGDAAVQAGLNAIAAARAANGFGPQMHNIAHNTFVTASDIARARAIGATFEVSPYLWAPSPINDDITKAVGPDLIKRVWPVREMLEAGAQVVPGSDWSVVPSVNPWVGMETLVTREVPGGGTTSFGKAEAINFEQAFDLFTVNSARQERMSDKVGRIEPGMLADIIVVKQNPFKVPASKIHETKVRMTFINGEKVYDFAEMGTTSAP